MNVVIPKRNEIVSLQLNMSDLLYVLQCTCCRKNLGRTRSRNNRLCLVMSQCDTERKATLRYSTTAPVPAVPVLETPWVNPRPSSLWCSRCNNLHRSQSILNKKYKNKISKKGMCKFYVNKYFLNFTIPIDQAMIGTVSTSCGAASWCLFQHWSAGGHSVHISDSNTDNMETLYCLRCLSGRLADCI